MFHKRGETAKAAKYFEMSSGISGRHKRCFNRELWLAACYEALGGTQKALESYHAFVKKHPDAWPIARRITVLGKSPN